MLRREFKITGQIGAIFKGQEVLFIPSDFHPLPEGLEMTKGLVKTTNGRKRASINIPIANTTNHPILLD